MGVRESFLEALVWKEAWGKGSTDPRPPAVSAGPSGTVQPAQTHLPPGRIASQAVPSLPARALGLQSLSTHGEASAPVEKLP